MSFGYGVGDFLAVSKLAWTVYNVYNDAPGDFKDISDEIKSLHIIVEGQHHDFQDRKLLPEEQKGLGEILQGCENVLKDLDELMMRYRGLGVQGNPRFIDRLKWDPENVANLRARLTSNTNLLNTFLASCQHKENQRSLAAIQQLLTHGINRRNSTTSIRSFASFATTRTAKAAWKEFCRNLNGAGVTTDMLRDRSRTGEILRLLTSSPAILEEVVGDTAAQHTDSPEEGTELEQPGPDSQGKKRGIIPTINWGPLINRIGGRRLLYEAAASGDNITVRAWLQVIRDLNYKLNGETALHTAASNGHAGVVKLLLEKGAKTEVTHNQYGQTALDTASLKGHSDVVELLLEKGANIEATSDNGSTPLYSAASGGHSDIVKLLLEKGANTEVAHNQYGRTALDTASGNGHSDVIELLLEKGANIEAKDRFGRTPLYSAALGGHSDVVKLLLENGANIEATRSDYGSTPLDVAASRGHADVVELLLEKGPNIEAKDRFGWTPLYSAALGGHSDVVKLLLEKGANIEATRSDDGSTPLYSAVSWGHSDVVKLLLEKGANIEATRSDYGSTPLDIAASRGHADVVELLLEKGAKIEATRSDNGSTPLHTAASLGHSDVVKLLLEKGANIEAKDRFGRTPLDNAISFRNHSESRLETRDLQCKRNEVIDLLRIYCRNVDNPTEIWK